VIADISDLFLIRVQKQSLIHTHQHDSGYRFPIGAPYEVEEIYYFGKSFANSLCEKRA
jgi:hypothetical protein